MPSWRGGGHAEGIIPASGEQCLALPCVSIAPNWSFLHMHGGISTGGKEVMQGRGICGPGPREECQLGLSLLLLLFASPIFKDVGLPAEQPSWAMNPMGEVKPV